MSKVPATAKPQVFYVRPAPGWLFLLHEEIQKVIKQPLQKYKFEAKVTLLKSTVKISRCDLRQGLELLLRLSTAHDVEWLILESKCTQWSEVDAILKRVPWNDFLEKPNSVVHVTADAFNGFTNLSSKLRDNFCKAGGVMHTSEGASLRFKIELRHDQLRITASLAGEPLYKRGYKAKMSATAPLPEHHAAACVRWILGALDEGQQIEQVFVPFAGSGTLGFEALLVLSGAGPGAFERKFACELFPCTPLATINFLKRKIKEQLINCQAPEVVFNEINPEAMSDLKANAEQFRPEIPYEFLEGDLFKEKMSVLPKKNTLILLNPPFGNRLGKDSSIAALYSRLGKYLRESFATWGGKGVGGCLCPDEQSWKVFTQELKNQSLSTQHFTHGGKEMRLVRWKF